MPSGKVPIAQGEIEVILDCALWECDNKCAITLPGVLILENIGTPGSELYSIHFQWELLYQHT